MHIRVFEGTATLSTEIPFFVGTTGKGEPGATNFPALGAPLKNFMFYPEKDDFGTLVFDRADPARRNVLTPTFFQYWWEDGKLIVREDFNSGRFKKGMGRSAICGFSYTIEDFHSYRVYCTRKSDSYTRDATKVGLLDLLKCIEGKISEDELKARAIA